jgi:uncharacterized protein (DUF1330 family)
MIAFSSMERARAWYVSDAYQVIQPIGHTSANSRVFIMQALPGHRSAVPH